MEQYLIWLIIALVLLGTEMMLASVYLIAFLLGALTASACAFFGCSLTIQCSLGAIVIIAGVICAYFYRKKIALLNNKISLDNNTPSVVNLIPAEVYSIRFNFVNLSKTFLYLSNTSILNFLLI